MNTDEAKQDMFKNPDEETNAFAGYTAIKAKFFAQERKIYGMLLLIFSPNNEFCEKTFLTLTTYSLDYNALGANSSYKDFHEAIYKKIKEGISFQNINFKTRSALENDFKIIDHSMKIPQKKDVMELEQDLKSILKKTMGDKKITVFTFSEKVSRDEYIEYFGKNNKSFAAKTDEFTNETAADTVNENVDIHANVNLPADANLVKEKTSLILAPLEGKPIFDLCEGHIIFLSINPANSNEAFDAKLHTNDNETIVRGKVTGNFYYDGMHHLGIYLHNNDYTLISEDANVKVKFVAAQIAEQETSTTQKRKNRRRSRFFIMASLGTIVFLLLTLFFLFIWVL